MVDYTDSKKVDTKTYPVRSKFTSGIFRRTEAFITPELLKSRYLHGIDMSDYTNEEIKQEIELALNEVELLTDLRLDKVQYKERKPFDKSLYEAFVYMKTDNGPVLSVESMSIESSNGENIYTLPPDWIEMGFAHKRQINLIPLLSIFGAAGLQDGQPTNAGLVFIQAVNNFRWLPAFFTITYTTGVCHKEGHLPIVLNDLVGLTAAMEILSAKQNLNSTTSSSISQDGISQSASNAGPQIYQARIDNLQAKRDKMIKKVRNEFHQGRFYTNI